MQALIYCRVSSKRQETEGHGLESQETRCREYAKTHGYDVVEVFKDSYSGGGDFMNRPAMRGLIKFIDQRPSKSFVIIFDDLKRFARDTEFHLKLRAALRVRGATPKCLNFNFDDTAEGKFVETMFAAQGELEREQNRRQVIQKQAARMTGGYRAFASLVGYEKVKDPIHGNLDIPNKDAEYVKEALEGFASLKFPQKIDVVRFLQEKGVLSKKQNPARAIAVVDGILREVFFAGYIEYEPWEISRRVGHHESLIGIETYEKNQKRLKNGAATFVRQDIRDDFELRGLVNCASCCQKLTAAYSTSKTGKKHAYYKCQNRSCEMSGTSIRREDIQSGFVTVLKSISASNDVIRLTKALFEDVWREEERNKDKIKQSLENRRDSLEGGIKKLTERIRNTENEVIINQYEKEIESLALELNEVEERLLTEYDYSIPYGTSAEEVLNVLRNPYSVWESYSVTQKQRFFHFIFEDNLVYSKIQGYRTPNYTLPIRLFEEIGTSSTVDVEMGGVEPPCRHARYTHLRA